MSERVPHLCWKGGSIWRNAVTNIKWLRYILCSHTDWLMKGPITLKLGGGSGGEGERKKWGVSSDWFLIYFFSVLLILYKSILLKCGEEWQRETTLITNKLFRFCFICLLFIKFRDGCNCVVVIQSTFISICFSYTKASGCQKINC